MMLCLCLVLIGLFQSAAPSAPSGSDWRSQMASQMETPAESTDVAKVERFEQTVRAGVPYAYSFVPGDYEANRALARSMATYLATLDVLSASPEMKIALRRAHRAVSLFAFALPPPPAGGIQEPTALTTGAPTTAATTPPAPNQTSPPFSMTAPDLPNLSAEEKPAARDLQVRYEMAAAQALGAWHSAAQLRANLNARGMTLNPATAAALGRLSLYLETAADALRDHNWGDAELNIRRAEGETKAVLGKVGR